MAEAPVVVGVADHRGWAVLVSVGERHRTPVVVDRRRVDLVDSELSSQPHHHEGAELGLEAAEELIGRVAASVALHARNALSDLAASLQPDARLVGIALEELPAIPATLAEVLASQKAMIDADGAMYRGALRDAARELGLEIAVHPRRRELADAAAALSASAEQLEQLLRHLGRNLGPPWRKEHRTAAAAAITTLAHHTRLEAGGAVG